MKTVAFHNLGCKVNAYEIEMMQQNALKAGWQIVDFSQKADIYVINTCSVTNIADRKSRQMLHKAKKQNNDAVVVAVGCYAQTDTKGAQADEAVDIVIGNNHKSELVSIVEDYMASKLNNVVVEDLSKPVEYEDCGIDASILRTRVDVKIQDGCDQFCTYCIIPYARGRIRSRRPEQVTEEITGLAKAGYREVVITGIHLSSYGLDLLEEPTSYNAVAKKAFTNEALIDVIERVAGIEGIERVRLGSLEPRVITKEFLERISAIKEICPHFHLSLQSGCDDTLVRMNRRYTCDEYAQSVRLIREYFEHPAITTDIIVGFPMESEEEFERSKNFVESIGFYETHIFKYSRRKGTVADRMQGQLTDAVKSARSDVHEQICAVNKRAFETKLIGKEEEILTEEHIIYEGNTYTVGHTKNYVRMAVFGQLELNEFVRGQVGGFLQNDTMLLKTTG